MRHVPQLGHIGLSGLEWGHGCKDRIYQDCTSKLCRVQDPFGIQKLVQESRAKTTSSECRELLRKTSKSATARKLRLIQTRVDFDQE